MILQKEVWTNDDYTEFLEYVRSFSNVKYQKFHSSLSPTLGQDSILGVCVPDLKKIAKDICMGNWRSFLDLDIVPYLYEERMIRGLVTAMSKCDFDEKIKNLTEFIPYINSWGVCDTVVAASKFIAKDKAAIFGYLKPYLASEKEYYIRFAVVVLLDFYINDEYIDSVLEIYDNIINDAYYVKMAVAWGLSVCYIKYPQKTQKYFENNKLDDFTYKKTVQKICDSYRVTPEQKKSLRRDKSI